MKQAPVMGGSPHLSSASLTAAADFLIIGGGVAGTTCAIELQRLCPRSKVTIVSPSSVVKAVRSVEHITPLLKTVDVQERTVDDFVTEHPGLSLVREKVISVDVARKEAKLCTGGVLRFARIISSNKLATAFSFKSREQGEDGFGRHLRRQFSIEVEGLEIRSAASVPVIWFSDAIRCCVATGASPSLAADHPRVIGIRDTESVENLSKWMVGARRVLIVGNGGIALELVHAIISSQACQVVWAVRDSYIGNTFFDSSASAFFLSSLSASNKYKDKYEEGSPSLNSSSASTISESPSGLDRDSEQALEGPVVKVGSSDETSTKCNILPESKPNFATTKRGGRTGGRNASFVAPKNYDYSVGRGSSPTTYGAGTGPDWVKILEAQGLPSGSGSGDKSSSSVRDSTNQSLLDIQFESELKSVRDGAKGKGLSWPMLATLTNGVEVNCDFVVSATGVEPNTQVLGPDFQRGPDGGVLVDSMMRVVRSSNPKATPGTERHDDSAVSSAMSAPKAHKEQGVHGAIFAAGDCTCMRWPERESAHWFQLRLWGQARAMGLYAAKCMADAVDELGSGGAFDLFVHATQFFGHKVALLGHFNGQGLGLSTREFVSRQLVVDPENALVGVVHAASPSQDSGTSDLKIIVRTTPGVEYIKVILERGRVRGAMLIGDTGLEETFENLILNGTDVSKIEDDLLSVDVDLEDYFD